MLTQKQLKYYSSLLHKKYRQKEKKFLIEGEKLVNDALNGSYKIEIAFLTNSFAEKKPDLKNRIKSFRLPFELLRDKDFEKLCDTVTPQGIAAVLKFPDKIKPYSSGIIVCIDNISDPGNLGTILRNCEWFGFKDILVSENSAEVFNPKVIRSAMGSLFYLNIARDVNLQAQLQTFKRKGYRIICSDLNGKDIYNYTFPSKAVIVFSNEASGPSDSLREIAEDFITIPGRGSIDSLNVASASAVILSEIRLTQS